MITPVLCAVLSVWSVNVLLQHDCISHFEDQKAQISLERRELERGRGRENVEKNLLVKRNRVFHTESFRRVKEVGVGGRTKIWTLKMKIKNEQ